MNGFRIYKSVHRYFFFNQKREFNQHFSFFSLQDTPMPKFSNVTIRNVPGQCVIRRVVRARMIVSHVIGHHVRAVSNWFGM